MMMTAHQIEQLVERQAFRILVDRILRNGRVACRAERDAMQSPEALATAGLGLALQRLCELSYGPSPAARRIVGRLLITQHGDGLFGGFTATTALPRALASAVALHGLALWKGLALEARRRHGPSEAHRRHDHALVNAIQRGRRGVAAALRSSTDLATGERHAAFANVGDADDGSDHARPGEIARPSSSSLESRLRAGFERDEKKLDDSEIRRSIDRELARVDRAIGAAADRLRAGSRAA